MRLGREMVMSLAEKSRSWRLGNPERSKAHQQNYRRRHRKPCKRCKGRMPFPSPGRLYCAACQTKRKWEVQHKFRVIRLSRMASYKIEKGCSQCGYNRCAAALDFHHVEPSKKIRRVWLPQSPERKKCVILCANCHRELHYKKKEENGDCF